MSCEWGREDCQNAGIKCHLCISDGYHYIAPKKRPRPMAHRAVKQDARMGSSFELKNHHQVKNLIEGVSTRTTPNSGAGHVKGDQQIHGLITVMEELKTKVKQQAPGKESFTIQRSWLDKLRQEAAQENKEFAYLKFSFHEHDQDVYVIVEQDVVMGMVYTMAEDRKAVLAAKQEVDIAKKRAIVIEAENALLRAQLDLLKAEAKGG